MVGCTRACLYPKAMLVSSHLALVDHHTPLGLALLEFLISALRERNLAYTSINGPNKTWCNACGAKCNMRHEQERPKHINRHKLF
jgi:hypothetical protein